MATPTTTTGWILRVGSYAGIAGALLGLVGNLLHPSNPHRGPRGVARTIADSRLWVPDHLAIVLGLILSWAAWSPSPTPSRTASLLRWPGSGPSPPAPASPSG
jgi:hypothetical protein